jgi:hypothetical protein
VLNDEFGYIVHLNIGPEQDELYYIYKPELINAIREPISVVEKLKIIFRRGMELKK